MSVTGVIAEYNPFHNGHAYQLAQIRKQFGQNSYIIAAISGNFVQRGAPALLDKATRAKMALAAGADLVLELPVLWATASAEYFAGAGVTLFDQLGCVDTLCFGCETPDLSFYKKICQLLIEEPASYKSLLEQQLKSGKNYAAARQTALCAQLPEAERPIAEKVLKSPNNILALEYQKALAKNQSKIRSFPIKRHGQDYHSEIVDTFSSASAIRTYLASQNGILTEDDPLKFSMPNDAYLMLADYRQNYAFLSEDDFSSMLHLALLQNEKHGFEDFADCTPDISNKIQKHLPSFISFTGFCQLLKSKDLTYARISRILLHILLGIQKSDYGWKSEGYIPYIRILGFRKEADELLRILSRSSRLPMLIRAADVEKLSKKAQTFYDKNRYADQLYQGILAEKCGHSITGDFQMPLFEPPANNRSASD